MKKRAPSSRNSVISPVASQTETDATSQIEAWLKENRGYALRCALNIVHDRDEADDAVAEASLRAIRSAHTYNPKQPMRQWFTHIVTMVCYEWLRAAKALKRPQTVPFSQLAFPNGGGDGESFHPAIDAPDVHADVAGEATRNVAAAFVGVTSGEGIADVGELPEWLLDGLRCVPEFDRALLLDVYVLQKPRKEIARTRGVSEYWLGQRLGRAQSVLRAVCGLPDAPGVPGPA